MSRNQTILLETNERITKDLVFGRVPDAFRPPAHRGPPQWRTDHKVSYLSVAASAAATRLPMPKASTTTSLTD